MTTKIYIPIFALFIALLSSCSPEPVCTDTFQVIAIETLEQPLTTNSDGEEFETFEEAELYANFLAQTDPTAYATTVTICN